MLAGTIKFIALLSTKRLSSGLASRLFNATLNIFLSFLIELTSDDTVILSNSFSKLKVFLED